MSRGPDVARAVPSGRAADTCPKAPRGGRLADSAPVVTHRAGSGRDPATMMAEERLAELGELLATGYRRHRLRQKELADGGDSERPCHSVNTPESPDDQEVA